MALPRIVIAGVKSGVGKTTIATGLMAALAGRGLAVQGFKVGPDYIDPGFHAVATGRPARNLDAFLVPAATLQGLFLKAAATADVSVIEGVMGLYDGQAGTGAGSTAAIAKLLQAPVLLVVDASSLGQSAAAMVLGYARYDPQVNLAGVILNRVASERHFRMLQPAIADATGLPVVGCLGREAGLELPARHLGLIPAAETAGVEAAVAKLATAMAAALDLDAILKLARSAPDLAPAEPPVAAGPAGGRVRLAVARDAAFNFYYQDGLDYLAACGAEIVPFSPLRDAQLPAGAAGAIIGGGFPEVFLTELAANESLKADLRRRAAAGLPVYAECGGLMYLCRSIVDQEGRAWPMIGLVPAECRMQPRLAGMGYRTAVLQRTSLLGPAGTAVWGHEFHYSSLSAGEAFPWAYRYVENEALDGYTCGSVLAAYLHMHWAGSPAAAASFLNACRAYAGGRKEEE